MSESLANFNVITSKQVFTSQNISTECTISIKGKTLFDEVHVGFVAGNRYGFIGKNGCGKTTFLRYLSSQIESNSEYEFGTVWYQFWNNFGAQNH